MKKISLEVISVFLLVVLIACQSDDENIKSSTERILVENSPWSFNRYELINIIDPGDGNFTKEDVENFYNTYNDGSQVNYYENGSGLITLKNGETNEWLWRITNNNEMEITIDINNVNIFKFNVSITELILESRNEGYGHGLINGKFIYE